jgi:hypothetical protein
LYGADLNFWPQSFPPGAKERGPSSGIWKAKQSKACLWILPGAFNPNIISHIHSLYLHFQLFQDIVDWL